MEQEFDDLPVNNNNNFEVKEFADEQNEEDLKEMSDPIQKRITSKNWKVRIKTYEELQVIYSDPNKLEQIIIENENPLQTISLNFHKYTQESNPNVLEKSIQMIAIFFSNISDNDIKKDNILQISYGQLTKNIIEKAISGKQSLKKNGCECLTNLFEKLENKQIVLETIQKLLVHKTVKIQQGAISGLLELLENFGVGPLEKLKDFFPLVEKLSQSTNQYLKLDCINFYKQAFLWMGEPILRHHMKNLKKNQIEELETFFKENPDSRQVAKKQKTEEKEKVSQIRGDEDPYDLVDAVDLSNIYTDKWCSQLGALAKWSARKDLLIQLADKLESSLKVLPSCAQVLGSFLRKQFQKESNVNVIQQQVKVAGLLARTIRKGFRAQAKLTFPFLLDKLGDKKVSLQEESHIALKSMCLAIELVDVGDYINKALESKNSTQLIQVLVFLSAYFQTYIDNPAKIKNNFAGLMKAIEKLQENSKKDVREASAKLLQLLSTIEENNNNNDNMVIHQTPRKSNAKEELNEQKKQNTTLNKNMSNKNISLNKSNSKRKLSTTANDQLDSNHQSEYQSIEIKFLNLYTDETLKQCVKEDNKIKVVQELLKNDNHIIFAENFKIGFSFLYQFLNEFQDINTLQFHIDFLNLLVLLFQVQQVIISEEDYKLISQYIVNRMGDIKYNQQIQYIYKFLLEQLDNRIIIREIIQIMNQNYSNLSNKQLDDIINIFKNILLYVGDTYYDYNIVVQQIVINLGYQSAQPSHLKQINQLVSVLIQYFGYELISESFQNAQGGDKVHNEISDLLQNNSDVEELLQKQSQINFRFQYQKELIKFETPQKQNKVIKKDDRKKNSLSITQSNVKPFLTKGGKKEKEEKDIQNKSLKVKKKQSFESKEEKKETKINLAIKLMKESNWEKRRLGLEQAREFLLEGRSAPQTIMNDLIKTFTSRIMDPHKQLQKQFIQSTSLFIQAVEPQMKLFSKNMIINLISILGDKNKELRELGLEQLCELGNAIGYEQVILLLQSYLSCENNFLKENALDIITQHCHLFGLSYLKNVFILCNDKSKIVRQKAELLVLSLVQSNLLTPQQLQMSTRDLKREQMKVIQKFLFKEESTNNSNSVLHDLNEPRSSKELTPPTQNMQNMVANYNSNQSEEQVQQESIIQLQQESQASLMKKQRVNLEDRPLLLEVDTLYVETLQCQMQAIINTKYLGQLFSLEFKAIISLCERMIVSCIEEAYYIYLITDLLLKWVYLILALKCDDRQKNKLLEKALEIVKHLLILFRENAFKFGELEVTVINSILTVYLKAEPTKHIAAGVQMIALLIESSEQTGWTIQFWLDHLTDSSLLPFIQQLLSTQSVLAKAQDYIPIFSNYSSLKSNSHLIQALLFTGQHSEQQLYQYGYEITIQENNSDLNTNNSGIYSNNKNKHSLSRMLKGDRTPRQGLSQTPSQVLSQKKPVELLQSFVKSNKNFMVEEELDQSHLMNLLKIFKYEEIRANLEDIVDSLMQLNDLALSDFKQHVLMLTKSAYPIIQHFLALLKALFTNRTYIQSHLIHYSIGVFHKLLVLKSLLNNLDNQQLSQLYYNLTQLLAEEESYKVYLHQRNEKKEVRSRMALSSSRDKSMSHQSDHSSGAGGECYSRSVSWLITSCLQLAFIGHSLQGVISALLEQAGPLNAFQRLILLKIIFKFNHVYCTSIDIQTLFNKFNQYLQTEYEGKNIVILIAKNIINHSPHYQHLEGNYGKVLQNFIDNHQKNKEKEENSKDDYNKSEEQVKIEMEQIIKELFVKPNEKQKIEKLYRLLQLSEGKQIQKRLIDKELFIQLLEWHDNIMVKEYILEELRSLYEKSQTLENCEQGKSTKQQKKGNKSILTKDLMYKLKHYSVQEEYSTPIKFEESLLEQNLTDQEQEQVNSHSSISIQEIAQELKQIQTEEDQKYANLLDSDFQHQLDDQYQNLLESEDREEIF